MCASRKVCWGYGTSTLCASETCFCLHSLALHEQQYQVLSLHWTWEESWNRLNFVFLTIKKMYGSSKNFLSKPSWKWNPLVVFLPTINVLSISFCVLRSKMVSAQNNTALFEDHYKSRRIFLDHSLFPAATKRTHERGEGDPAVAQEQMQLMISVVTLLFLLCVVQSMWWVFKMRSNRNTRTEFVWFRCALVPNGSFASFCADGATQY